MKINISFENDNPHYIVRLNGDIVSMTEDIGEDINIVVSSKSDIISCKQIRALSEMIEELECENVYSDKIDVSLLV